MQAYAQTQCQLTERNSQQASMAKLVVVAVLPCTYAILADWLKPSTG